MYRQCPLIEERAASLWQSGHCVATDETEEWWSPQEAHRQTGMSDETIRRWARAGDVKSRRRQVGKRENLLEVPAREVRAKAATARRGSVAPAAPTPLEDPTPPEDSSLDRLSVLEEVARRHRMIDELRQTIERCHQDIEAHQREIEELALGPATVPND